MKRTVSGSLIFLMLGFMMTALAGSPGTAADPLISLSYLTGTFTDSLKTAASNNLETAAGAALARMNIIYKVHVEMSFAPGFTPVSLSAGDKTELVSGGSFILLSGAASIDISSGTVINTATGTVVSQGTQLALDQRYLCTELAVISVTASEESAALVDGYFNTDGQSGTAVKNVTEIFSDIPENAWFIEAVSYVYNHGLFSGTAADTFSPDLAMTRAMFVTVLHRLDGKPASPGAGAFSDVADSSLYYYDAVSWASSNEIVTGFENGVFMPDASVTREQMAAIMYRYAMYKDRQLAVNGAALAAFPDGGAVSQYALEPMRWAVTNEIIKGSDGMLLPQSTATRAQVAQIIYNFR